MYDVIMAANPYSLREAINELIEEVNKKKKEGWRTVGGIDTNARWPVANDKVDSPSFFYACQAMEKD